MVDAAAISRKRAFREFYYKGKSLEELINMPLSAFCELLPSKLRRHIKRGITKEENEVLEKVLSTQNNPEQSQELIKTHERDMVIFPCMVSRTIAVHCGNGYQSFEVRPEMIGTRLKDYVMTRVICTHGKPGIGASASSKFVPLK